MVVLNLNLRHPSSQPDIEEVLIANLEGFFKEFNNT
jgi:hypothetical protein